jgi:hypothetical protein
MANKKNILQQCVTSQPGIKKRQKKKLLNKTKSVLLEWFRKKWALNIPTKCPLLRQKA